MSAEDLYRLLKQRPFQPFRIDMTDGRSYEVRFPAINLVLRSTFVVGIPTPNDADPVAEHRDFLHIPDIHKVEMIPTGEASMAN